MPEEKDKIKLLYDAFSSKIDVGSPEQFETILKDKTKRNLLYQKASSIFEIGGENDFNNLVDTELKKKSSSTSSSNSGEKAAASPLPSSTNLSPNKHWPQLDLSSQTPEPGINRPTGIPWPQLDLSSEKGQQAEFKPQPIENFDPEKFKVKAQTGIQDFIDPNEKLGEKINKDLEKTTNIMNTYKTAIGNLEGKISADIKQRDALATELKDIKAQVEKFGSPKTQEEALQLQALYDEYNQRVDLIKKIQESADNKYAAYQTISKGYENRVKELDPLMRTLDKDESEWLPYWDRVGAPMLGSMISSLPNQLLRVYAMASTPFTDNKDISESLAKMNRFIEVSGLKNLDDFAKAKLIESERNAMKLRMREGTDLETLFQGDASSIYKNKGKIIDLAMKQAIASGPITVAALGATVLGGLPAGAAMTFLGTGGSKYAGLKDRTDMSEQAKIMSSVGEGTFETLFEFLPDVLNAKVVINSIKGMGKKQAADQVKKSLTDAFFDVYGKFFPITAPVGEGIGEMFTGIGQRYTDTLFDPEVAKLSDEKKFNYIFGENYSKLKSEFAGGAAGATFFVAPQLAAETISGIRDPKNRQKVKDLFTKKQAIQADIEKGNVSGPAADAAQSEIDNINGQISDIVKKNTVEGESITTDQKGAAEQLNEQIDAIDQTIQNNPAISPETASALETKKKDLEGQIKEVTSPTDLINKLQEVKINEQNPEQKAEPSFKEVKPKSTSVFLPNPNSDGSFNKSSEKKSFEKGASVMAFEPIGNNRFNVYVDSDKSAQNLSLTYPDKFVQPIFDEATPFTPEAKSVQVVKPAVVELRGDKYVLIEKGQIDYDNAAIKKEASTQTAKPTPADALKDVEAETTPEFEEKANNILGALNIGRSPKDAYELIDSVQPIEGYFVITAVNKKGEKVYNLLDEQGNPPDGFTVNWRSMQHIHSEILNEKSQDETNTGSEERSTETLITEGRAIEAEAANHQPGQSSKSILQKLEDHINSINAKIVKLTETWDESQLPEDERAGRQAGKAAKKEVRKYAGEVAKLLGWKAISIHDNIPPAGGEVTFRLEIPDTPLEMYVAFRYKPDYGPGGYENYKLDQFFYRVEKMGKSVGQNQWMFFNKPQFGLKQEASIPTPKQFANVLAKLVAPDIEMYNEGVKQTGANVRISQAQDSPETKFINDAVKAGESYYSNIFNSPDAQNAEIAATEAAKELYHTELGKLLSEGNPLARTLDSSSKRIINSIKNELLIESQAWGNKQPKKTQEQQVKQVLEGADEGKSIKEIAEATGILEPNVRRILGVGAKAGKFERIGPGVYVLKDENGKETAYIEAGDAKETLARFAEEGRTFDMVFLDPAYFSRALIGGNRGIKEYSFILPPDFEDVMKSVAKLVGDDNHVYVMLSGAQTAQKDMVKYVDGVVNAGFKLIGEGGYQKTFADGSPVTNVRGEVAKPERLMLFTKSGNARAGEIPVNLNFRFVRPSVKNSYQTEKPKELLRALIQQSTFEGETILDPFAGSGVTGEQAIETGRKPTLVEKNPEVVENIIIPRVEGSTSKLKQKIKAIEDKELDDLWDDFNKSTTTNTGLNPEQLAKAMKLTAKYIELGVLKFADIVADAYARFGKERLVDIFPGLKQAYGAYLMTDEADSIDGLSEPKEVKTFDLNNFINTIENDSNGNEASGGTRGTSTSDTKLDARGPQGGTEQGTMATGESTNAEPIGNVPNDNGQPIEIRNEPDTGEPGSNLGDIRPELIDANIQQNWLYPKDWVRNSNKTFSKTKAYADNIAALEIINELLDNPERYATEKEKAILALYNGLGPLTEILIPSNDRNHPEWTESKLQFFDASRRVRALIKQIGEKTKNKGLVINEPDSNNEGERDAYSKSLETARSSARNAYYTSLPVIDAMWQGLLSGGFIGGKVLEGSVGSGRFIGGMPKDVMSNSRIKGVDMDVVSSLVAGYLYPKASITNNRIQKASIPSNAYDLFISNIPFGKEANLYDPLLSKKGKDYAEVMKLNKLHAYFFAKAIDTVRPGGYIAILTSSNTLDTPENKPVRDFIENHTDFMGAVRLPSSAFAAESGTEVVTDIILMRKKAQPERPQAYQLDNIIKKIAPNSNKNKGPQEIRLNSYFEVNPQNVLGTEYLAGGLYDNSTGYSLSGTVDPSILAERLKSFALNFPYQKNDVVSEEDSLKTLQVSPLGRMVSGGIIEVDDSYYKVIDFDNKTGKYNLEEIKKTILPSSKEILALKTFVKLKNNYFKVLAADKSGQDATGLRTELKVSLSEFIQEIKPTKINNIGKGSGRLSRLIATDPDFYAVTSLVNDEGKYADIVLKPNQNVVTGDVKTDDPADAVAASINTYGKISIPFIKRAMNLDTDEQVLGKIKDLIFETLDGEVIENSEYLSGNVRVKLNQAKEWAETDKKFQRNVDALTKVLPEDIPLVYPAGHKNEGEPAIKFQLGASWVPDRYINLFMDSVFGEENMLVKYVQETDDYQVESSLEGGEYMASGNDTTRPPSVVVKAALSKNVPQFQRKISDTETETLYELINDVRDKAQTLQEAFQNLIITDPKMGQELARLYNDKFNSIINISHDGSKLTFPGMQGYELNPHQKDAIMMLIKGLGGMIDHIVGAGKTLVMAVAAIKMRQLGLINKPMITTMKSVVPGMVEQIKTQYPDARVLAPKESDFNKDNRQRLFAQIANNDWDVIVITHENLNKISLPKQFEEQYINEEISNLIDAMEDFNGKDPFSAKQRKALEIRIAGLRAKLERMQAKENASTIDFGEMGVDFLMVDESQQFKNLDFISKLRNVAGLGTAKGSGRASNLKMVARFLQNMYGADKGVVFASGTPISNSLVEVYNIFQFLRPSLMKELRINSLDQFIKNFGEITTSIEKNVAGVAKAKTRLAKFVNIPELAKFYTEISDIRGAHNLKLPRPEIKGGKPELVLVPQSETQQMITDSLFNSSLTGSIEPLNNIDIFPSGEAEKALGLVVTTLGTKASIDPRMIYPKMQPDGGKLFALADRVLDYYIESKDIKGTQLIFSDKGTPKNKLGSIGVRVKEQMIELFGEEYIDEFSKADDVFKIKDETELSLKMVEVFDISLADANAIIREANDVNSFNVYQETKNLLIARGIPAEEIAFVHDAPTKKQKEELFAKVKKGEIRVLLGSTMKLGTGVNVQDRVVAMHHLDIGWRPSDLEQRNGRGLRRGNINEEVAILYYATENTIDSYMFGVVGIKQSQLDQFRSGAGGIREMEFVDGEGMSLAEVSAAISGDTRMLDLEKLKGQEAKLKSRIDSVGRTNFVRQRRIDSERNSLDRNRKERDFAKGVIEKLEDVKVESYEYFEPLTKPDTGEPVLDAEGKPKQVKKVGKRALFVAEIDGTIYDSSIKEQETAFYNLLSEKIEDLNQRQRSQPTKIGEINGVPIFTSSTSFTVKEGRKNNYIPNPDFHRTLYFGDYIVSSGGDYSSTQGLLPIVYKAIKLPSNAIKTYINGFFNELNEAGNSEYSRIQMRYANSVARLAEAEKEPVIEAKQKDIEELARLSAKKNALIADLKGEASGEVVELNQLRPIYRPGERPKPEPPKQGGGPDDSGPKQKGLADRGIDALERMKINTNNTMFGMLPPFALAIPIWNGAVSAMQDAIRLGKFTANIIQDGLDYITNQGVVFGNETDFIDYFTSILDGPPDGPEYTPQDIENERQSVSANIQDRYSDLERTLFGSSTSTDAELETIKAYGGQLFGLVNRAQDKLLGNAREYVGDALANAYAKKAVSNSKLVRNIAGALNGLFAGLSKTKAQQLKGEEFAGNIQRSISDANQISKWLRHAIENNPESLNRIDQVLDPEFYNKMSLERFKSYLKDEIGEEDYNAIPEEELPDWYAQYLLDIGYNEGYKPITIDDLTPAELEVYAVIRNINNFLHDLNFVNKKIPYSTYLKNKGKYIARLYSKYELPKDANDIITNNNREHMNIFRKRGEITEWKVANRLSDPIYATTKRLYQTLMNSAIYDYSQFVLTQPGQVSRIPMEGYTQLGRGYGALTGKYVRDDIAEDFKGFFYVNKQLSNIYDYLKQYDRWTPRQFYKKLFTVWNPGVHLGNLTSNYVFAYLSGINAGRLSLNVPKAIKEINEYGPMYRYLIAKGVLKSSLSQVDLVNSITTLDKLTLDATESQSVWSKLAEIPISVYAGVDDVYKIAAYISLLEEGMSPNKAVDRVMEGFQNYKRVGKTYDVTSKIPFVGKPFGKFAGDLMRISKNAVTTRPLQTAAFIAALHAIAYLASKMSGEDDRERRIRASRPGFPKIPMPEMLGGDIELGYKIGHNEFNVARLITPLFIYSGVDDGDAYDAWQKFSPLPLQVDTWTNHPSGTGTVNLAKNFGSDPILSPILQLWLNADFRGVPILDPKESKYVASTLTDKEKLTNAIGFLLRSYGGSWYALLDDFTAAAKGEEDYYGRTKTPAQVVSRFFGVKLEKFPDTKYGKIMESKAKAYQYQLEDNKKLYNTILKQYGLGQITKEVAEKRMIPVIEERADIINKMKEDFGAK